MDHEAFRSRVHKFSCKPPGHDAARQRENQRRHRARVKGRVDELEAALLSTQKRLDEALERIDTLTAVVRRLHALGSSHSTPQTQPAAQKQIPGSTTCTQQGPNRIGIMEVNQHEPSEPDSCAPESGTLTGTPGPYASSPYVTTQEQDITVTTPPPGHAAIRESPSTSSTTLADLHTDIEPVAGIENPNNDCPLLPPPGAGESTIPCGEAYSIIKDRSTPEIDLSAVNEWLKPGFRRAIVPGTGCRVQTHLLFALVDHITPI